MQREQFNKCYHKLFGEGMILELWQDFAIVKFHNPKFGLRKIALEQLTKPEKK